MASSKTRTCDRCLKVKVIDLFGRRTGRGDGIARVCRRCVSDRKNQHNAANRTEVTRKQRIYRTNLSPGQREASRLRTSQNYFENREEILQQRKLQRAALKAEMIAAYGGKCRCCGEEEIGFLTLDHTNNDGAAHRREIGNTYGTWIDLRRRKWPKRGFRLLCYNCNCGRHRNGGVCPHITSRLRYNKK